MYCRLTVMMKLIPAPTGMTSFAAAALCLARAATAAPSCGSPPALLNASTPNVLILGDSISMGYGVNAADTGYGYGLNVAKMLAGPYPEFCAPTAVPSSCLLWPLLRRRAGLWANADSKQLAGGLATVQHGGGFGSNGGSSANGVSCIDSWLGGKKVSRRHDRLNRPPHTICCNPSPSPPLARAPPGPRLERLGTPRRARPRLSVLSPSSSRPPLRLVLDMVLITPARAGRAVGRGDDKLRVARLRSRR